jgi:hypothetical protein
MLRDSADVEKLVATAVLYFQLSARRYGASRRTSVPRRQRDDRQARARGPDLRHERWPLPRPTLRSTSDRARPRRNCRAAICTVGSAGNLLASPPRSPTAERRHIKVAPDGAHRFVPLAS